MNIKCALSDRRGCFYKNTLSASFSVWLSDIRKIMLERTEYNMNDKIIMLRIKVYKI